MSETIETGSIEPHKVEAHNVDPHNVEPHNVKTGPNGDPAIDNQNVNAPPTDPPIKRSPQAIWLPIALLILCDWLYWNKNLGISVALGLGALAIGVVIANFKVSDLGRQLVASVIVLFALAPLVEAVNPLSICFGVFGIALFGLIVTKQLTGPWPASFFEPIKLLIVSPYRLPPSILASSYADELNLPFGNAIKWIMPVALSLVFLFLFAAANPIIGDWVSAVTNKFSLRQIWLLFDVWRWIFWFLALSFIWAIIHARSVSRPKKSNVVSNNAPKTKPAPMRAASHLFGQGAILRALFLFNLLFGLQTGLDVMVLWQGTTLPDGMNYASYAHRGAYPLIATILLAAIFIILSFGPGRASEDNPRARGLVFLWLAQNLLLAITTFERLTLYVDVYALSYWRVAVFIWLALIAIGLVLITLRIIGRRSNAWLIGSNLAVTSFVLYGCCFINFAHIIATYNVEQVLERTEKQTDRRPVLDRNYLRKLGSHALPAINYYAGKKLLHTPSFITSKEDLEMVRRSCFTYRKFHKRYREWRNWSFRDYRLMQYLKSKTMGCPPVWPQYQRR